jgi:hypothetical protein
MCSVLIRVLIGPSVGAQYANYNRNLWSLQIMIPVSVKYRNYVFRFRHHANNFFNDIVLQELP